MSGKRSSSSSGMMEQVLPSSYARLLDLADLLEKNYSDMQRIEFTVENGEVYILQSRSGDRSAFSSVAIAVNMVKEHLITERQALVRVDSNKMDYFTHLVIDPTVKYDELQQSLIGRGTPANEGVISGKIAFNNEQAQNFSKKNVPYILVLQDTTSDDVLGITSCAGVLIMNGSITCHSASVARELGKPVIVLAHISGMTCLEDSNSLVTHDKKRFGCDSIITIDSTLGNIYQGSISLIPTEKNEDYQLILQWAKKYKRMVVMANATTPSDIALSLSLESEGCQVLPEIVNDSFGDLMRTFVFSSLEVERLNCLALLEKEQINIYFQIFSKFGFGKSNLLANPNNKITCKLLSTSLTNLLPSKNNPSYVQELQSIAKRLHLNDNDVLLKASQLTELNPILGVRGCRIAVLYPELIAMQTKAIITAAVQAFEEGISINAEILIPLSSSESEIRYILKIIKQAANEVFQIKNSYVSYSIGAEIDTPRAALRSRFIAAM
jgi:pyruvate,orthophosphate dikinase